MERNTTVLLRDGCVVVSLELFSWARQQKQTIFCLKINQYEVTDFLQQFCKQDHMYNHADIQLM